jgi:mitochondrial Rho GTPase 1
VLCANKSDLASGDDAAQVIEEEMLPLMAEFKVEADQHGDLYECPSCLIGDRRSTRAYEPAQKISIIRLRYLVPYMIMWMIPSNIRTKVFYLCQKAVTHPIAPLFDSKESVSSIVVHLSLPDTNFCAEPEACRRCSFTENILYVPIFLT